MFFRPHNHTPCAHATATKVNLQVLFTAFTWGGGQRDRKHFSIPVSVTADFLVSRICTKGSAITVTARLDRSVTPKKQCSSIFFENILQDPNVFWFPYGIRNNLDKKYHRSQIIDHRSQIIDHISQIIDHRSQIIDCISYIIDHRSSIIYHDVGKVLQRVELVVLGQRHHTTTSQQYAMDRLWIDNGQITNRLWIDTGQILDRYWIDYGQIMDRLWINNGQIMDKLWIDNGQILDRYTGQIMDR